MSLHALMPICSITGLVNRKPSCPLCTANAELGSSPTTKKWNLFECPKSISSSCMGIWADFLRHLLLELYSFWDSEKRDFKRDIEMFVVEKSLSVASSIRRKKSAIWQVLARCFNRATDWKKEDLCLSLYRNTFGILDAFHNGDMIFILVVVFLKAKGVHIHEM